jgi:exopolysaccharide production protein ExoQ
VFAQRNRFPPIPPCAAVLANTVSRPVRHTALLGGAFGLGRLLERGFVVVMLVSLTGGISLFRNPDRYAVDMAAGDPVLRVVYATVYGIVGILLLREPKRLIASVIRQKLLWGLLALAAASFFWSAAPDVTGRRIVAATGTTLVGVYMALRYSIREQLVFFAVALSIAAMGSLLVVLLLPQYGISVEFHEGAWRGLFSSKQGLGKHMLLGAVVMVFVSKVAHRWRYLAWIGFALTVFLVIMSTSKTPIAVAAVLVLLLPATRIFRTRTPLGLAVACGFVALSAAVFALLAERPEVLVGAMGKDLTLTGRTDLWMLVYEAARERLWLGYGLGGFWTGWTGASGFVWDAIGWPAPHAHNGLLDVWLELGLTGVILFLVLFARAIGRALAWLRRSDSFEGQWPLFFLVMFGLLNIPSSLILDSNSIQWAIFVAVVCSLSAEPIERRGLTAQSRRPPVTAWGTFR